MDFTSLRPPTHLSIPTLCFTRPRLNTEPHLRASSPFNTCGFERLPKSIPVAKGKNLPTLRLATAENPSETRAGSETGRGESSGRARRLSPFPAAGPGKGPRPPSHLTHAEPRGTGLHPPRSHTLKPGRARAPEGQDAAVSNSPAEPGSERGVAALPRTDRPSQLQSRPGLGAENTEARDEGDPSRSPRESSRAPVPPNRRPRAEPPQPPASAVRPGAAGRSVAPSRYKG